MVEGLSQVAVHLSSKCKALTSISTTSPSPNEKLLLGWSVAQW
jgi:hypothetical protein